MGVSDDTLLRLTKRAATGRAGSPRVVGVDDWAWKKQYHYGTILVDLEKGETVDVLAERSATGLAEWLTQRPGVELVTRDRHGQYAEGAATGAPQAEQIADRYHLILNLRDAVTQELNRQRKSLVLVPERSSQAPSPEDLKIGALPGTAESDTAACSETPGAKQKPHRSEVLDHRRQVGDQRRVVKQALFDKVRQMHLAGKTVVQIECETQLNRRRLYKWVRLTELTELPERNKMEPKPSSPSYFRDYLAARWEQGCRHGRTLFAEIRGRGYTGGFSWIAHYLQEWRCAQPQHATTPSPPERQGTSAPPRANAPCDDGRHVSPLVAAALVMKPRPLLTEDQRQTVNRLRVACPDFGVMRSLAMSFRGILLRGKPTSLDLWMAKAAATGIYAMKRFVRTLRHDLAAVKNAVTYQWSNGPVEGHINRLKTLKRQMYGRAGVELLRARMLPLQSPTLANVHQL